MAENATPRAALLSVRDLTVEFATEAGIITAVDAVSFDLHAGEILALVGESGCGKSATALALLRLIADPPGRITSGSIRFRDTDLLKADDVTVRDIRGNRIAMIFQEPMTSLNPAYTIGSQLTEVLRRHRRVSRTRALDRAAELLGRVGITAQGMRLGQYPHQLSGGLRQRVMIAMALMCEPALLIADEPTTALDVTVQAQILRLLRTLQQELGLALLLITHDFGIVARMADRVSVMYAGEIVECAPCDTLFAAPTHPYTRGLLRCIPVPGATRHGEPLGSIPGAVPRVGPGFTGCAFRDRCVHAIDACARDMPRRTAAERHDYLCRLPPDWTRAEAA